MNYVQTLKSKINFKIVLKTTAILTILQSVIYASSIIISANQVTQSDLATVRSYIAVNFTLSFILLFLLKDFLYFSLFSLLRDSILPKSSWIAGVVFGIGVWMVFFMPAAIFATILLILDNSNPAINEFLVLGYNAATFGDYLRTMQLDGLLELVISMTVGAVVYDKFQRNKHV